MKIKIQCTGTQDILLDNLTELQGNLKELQKENYEKLKESILKYGFSFPMFVWKDKKTNYIIDAHQRKKVLKQLESEGYEIPPLPTVFIKAKNKREAKEKLLQLNSNYGKITQDGLYEFINESGFEIDKELLKDIDLPEFDMDKFNAAFLEDTDNGKDDEVPDVLEDPVSKLGDLWILGNHRLLCGDSTKKEDVKRLMDGDKADMVFTDPPYGMKLDADYSGLSWGNRKGKKYNNVIGDHEDFKPELIKTIFDNFGYCKEIFLWGVDYYYKNVIGFDNGNYIVWDKTLKSNGDAGSNSEYELLWSKVKHKRVVLHFNWFRYFGLSQQDIKTREHPTQKPLQVCEPFINKYAKENNIIADLYLGSGSTLIACEKTNRKCYGMELDEHYCDVIIKRWEDFTGQKAKHENGQDFSKAINESQLSKPEDDE